MRGAFCTFSLAPTLCITTVPPYGRSVATNMLHEPRLVALADAVALAEESDVNVVYVAIPRTSAELPIARRCSFHFHCVFKRVKASTTPVSRVLLTLTFYNSFAQKLHYSIQHAALVALQGYAH
jgi:hypothetical protein